MLMGWVANFFYLWQAATGPGVRWGILTVDIPTAAGTTDLEHTVTALNLPPP